MTKLILIILILGVIYKLLMTWDGNFLFNMDNARDMVDVREMVELKKLRLTGPTSAIEGLFNGPAWYYLLAIPFILSGGNPYASIVAEILLWAIGGFFLLKIVERWGKWIIVPVSMIWISSNYITLTTLYAFNPNPVTLLSPLFVYLFYKYLETNKFIFIASSFLLGGLFFNFEMNFGIFIPLIIFMSTLLGKSSLLKTKNFWLASLFFLICLLPQILFEIRHNFFMTNSVINYLRNSQGESYNFFLRFQSIFESFLNVFSATLMNHKGFTFVIILLFGLIFIKFIKDIKKDRVVLISLLYIFIPFIIYLVLPVTVNPWHLGAEAVAFIILSGFLIKTFWDLNLRGKLIASSLSIFILSFAFSNIGTFFFRDIFGENLDPSLYKNEIAAIDYVYKHANGQNFKVYTYLPSVYDYPYQYLFWWYGKKKYGYIPYEYAYAPHKPQYISNKHKFEGSKDNYKGLVFLIKEPNRGFNWKSGWEADYRFMELISQDKLGNLEIEVRKEAQ